MAKVNTKGILIALGISGAIAGIYIYRDKLKKAAKSVAKDVINFVFDKQQEYYLSDLHPSYQNKFRQLVGEMEKLGYKVLITSGYRSFEKQAELKKENPKNASVGASMHNYGLAIDLNLISKKDGTQLMKASTEKEWEKTGVVRLAEKLGFKWGGNAYEGYYDPVHFEIPLGGKNLYAKAIKQFGAEDKVIGNRINLAA